MDISLALQTLLSAPEGSLESHRSQALSLAETIWRSLRATSTDATASGLTSSYNSEDESDSTETSGPRGPSSVSSADIVPSLNDGLRPVRRTQIRDLRPQRLLTTMEERISDMKKISEKGARMVVEEVLISFVDEDGRLSDVTRVVGKKNAGDEERLIQCLAQRALALEYTQWELQVRRLKKTRVQELAERLSNTNSQSGHIAQSIRCGIKQLLQEKLLSDKLSEGAECEARILNFLMEQSRWISECQAVYNGSASTNERSAKRQRQDEDASSISGSLRELYPNQSFRPIQKKPRAAYSQLPSCSTVQRLLSPTVESHQNLFDSAEATHSQTVTGACGPAFVSDNSGPSRTPIEQRNLPNEQQVLSFDNSVVTPNEDSEAIQHGTGVTSQESSAFGQYQNSSILPEQLNPGFNSLGYYHNTAYPPVPFNNPPLVGFSDWGLVNWDLQGFQDVCFQPISDGS
ncbi:hypothetical protein AFUB_097450 [Aspergillus fumigatus A1163]|uniref:Uncharacterized protein n=1 Tax=Aspergillus fumigatus (strain CBS 144.89 / FGSC A1163 / CEA10) TaxID=451804 RepID=B0YE10_ASPFC|nr:hypothetical protein AFUB_097450 [Aspergillus fumigatus A1163]